MILDFNNMTLRYIINDHDYGKAFDIENGEYMAAVYMYDTGFAIRILQC